MSASKPTGSESRPGGGASMPGGSLSAPPSLSGDVAVPSVLLVDDRPANLLALESILEPLRVHTVRASSGEEALKQLLKHDFALILLDVQMPHMDGFDTATAIKAHPRTATIPIIFVTAISREAAHVFKGYARGAVDYIMKPFDPDILRAKVSIFVDLYMKGETIKAQAKLLHQKELEAVERRNELRFRRLTDLLPLLMSATRPDGTVYYVNRAWTAYFGAGAEGTPRLDSASVVHPDEIEAARAAWAKAQAGGGPVEIECRLRRGDGEYRWHLVRAAVERADGHSGASPPPIEGWIVTAVDIDAQKQAEQVKQSLLEAEQEARKAAEAATRLKDEFLATVSHELRTPLHSILGWTKMLRSKMLDPARVSRAMETIERNAEAQRELIDDLLDVSRIIKGKMRLQRRTIDVVAVAQAAVDTVRPTAEGKGVELRFSHDPSQLELFGDPERLQQVVWNLVSNSVKFTPKGGHVDVRLRGDGATATLEVSDDGAGIAAEFLPHVFDRFRQADNTITRAYQGLGLGLAIVRHLVELHEGTIAAESEGPERGATFRVVLPLRAEEADEPALPTLETPVGSGTRAKDERLAGVRVLFVEDDADARDLFAAAFQGLGADVVAVESVSAAVDALASRGFDVLVSDIGLRGEDGFSLIRKVRAMEAGGGPPLPAIAVSGFARSDDGRRALEEGFQVYLTKPVEPSELIDLVASLSQAHESCPPSRASTG
jgi:PAS domain S-box-containing protein